MRIREHISSKLGIVIRDGGWAQVFSDLDRSGKLTQRVLKDLFVGICEYLEAKEVPIENMNRPPNPNLEEPFK